MGTSFTSEDSGARFECAEQWAREVIRGVSLASKLDPGPCPRIGATHAGSVVSTVDVDQISDVSDVGDPARTRSALRATAIPPEVANLEPSRPEPLRVTPRAPKTPRPGALVRPAARAQILHTFAHHELQAAEIFCWAFLAFPDAPAAFRRGLLGIAQDELRHTREYIEQVERLGSHFGAFEVRDWFWQRFADVRTPLQFVSLMGIGLEGANLDHANIWSERFRTVGDEAGADCQDSVGREEEPHVAFAVQWFERWAGPLEFDTWRAELPAPLTPTVMRGPELQRAARARCGMNEAFLNELDAWDPQRPGS